MGVFTRLQRMVARSLDAEVASAQDPEAAVRALIKEMREGVADARAAFAMAIRDERRLDREAKQALAEVDRWHGNARQALLARRDDLARQALARKAQARTFADQLEREHRRLVDTIAQLKRYVTDLNAKLHEAQVRERVLLSRRRRIQQAEALAERFPERKQQLLKAALEDLGDEVTRDALKGPLLDEDPLEREFRLLEAKAKRERRKQLPPARSQDEELARLKRELEDGSSAPADEPSSSESESGSESESEPPPRRRPASR